MTPRRLTARPSRTAIAGAALCALVTAAPGPATALAPLQEAGQEVWFERYDPPDRSAAGLEPLVAPNGTALYAVGSTSDGDASSYRVAAFDPATGERSWAVERAGSAHAAVLSPDGARIYLAGVVRIDDVTHEDWAVIALDASNGDELWSTVFARRGRRDHPNDIAVSPDGALVHVVGRSMDRKRRGQDFAVLTLDAVSGDEVWAHLHDGSDGRQDEAFAVAVDPNGERVFVTGMVTVGDTETFGHPDTAYATIGYDAVTGQKDWYTGYEGPSGKFSSDIPVAMVTDGNAVYVTGQSTSLKDDPDWFTAAYTPLSGGELWTARYNRESGSEDAPYSMALGPSGGRLYVTGASGVRNFDGVTIAYRTRNGNRAWTARFGARGTDFGWDVAASPDGERVYVTGETFTEASQGADFVTIGYSAHDGAVEWAARYSGPGGSADVFPTVAVQRDSERVFVVGRESDDGNIVFTTLAYQPFR